MKAAAIGVSVHSGWGAVVTIAGKRGEEEVLHRRRLKMKRQPHLPAPSYWLLHCRKCQVSGALT